MTQVSRRHAKEGPISPTEFVSITDSSLYVSSVMGGERDPRYLLTTTALGSVLIEVADESGAHQRYRIDQTPDGIAFSGLAARGRHAAPASSEAPYPSGASFLAWANDAPVDEGCLLPQSQLVSAPAPESPDFRLVAGINGSLTVVANRGLTVHTPQGAGVTLEQ